MFKSIRNIRLALQCIYLITCIAGAAKLFYNLDKMSSTKKSKKKRDRKNEIVVEFID